MYVLLNIFYTHMYAESETLQLNVYTTCTINTVKVIKLLRIVLGIPHQTRKRKW